ncbi:hypothetical protein [Methanosarcina horonobensis]|nr:hypothetical protein [Methanosarcina horonobensis]
MRKISETIDVISSHQMSLIKRKGKWKRIEEAVMEEKSLIGMSSRECYA